MSKDTAPESTSWAELRTNWSECTRCALHEKRTKVVLGTGAVGKIMIVGQYPGRDEDSSGIPFCGVGGQYTQRAAEIARIPWDACFLDNCLGCRSVGKPRQAMVNTCRPRLEDTIALVSPRLIVACGAVATKWFSGTQFGMEIMSGTTGEYNGIPVYYCTHPMEPFRLMENPNAVEKSVNKVRREWRAIGDLARELEILPRLYE